MFEVERRITVPAEPEAVWELVADFDAHRRWRDELVSMTHRAGPPRGEGARWEEVIAVGPLRVRSSLLVTVFEPPRQLVFAVEEPSRFPSENVIALRPDGGTGLRFTSTNRTSGTTALLDPLWRRLFGRSLDRELANLRRVVAGGSGGM